MLYSAAQQHRATEKSILCTNDTCVEPTPNRSCTQYITRGVQSKHREAPPMFWLNRNCALLLTRCAIPVGPALYYNTSRSGLEDWNVANLRTYLFYRWGTVLVPPSISGSIFSHSPCVSSHCSVFFSQMAEITKFVKKIMNTKKHCSQIFWGKNIHVCQVVGCIQ